MITDFINKRTKEKNAELPQVMIGGFRPSSPLFVLQPLSVIGRFVWPVFVWRPLNRQLTALTACWGPKAPVRRSPAVLVYQKYKSNRENQL